MARFETIDCPLFLVNEGHYSGAESSGSAVAGRVQSRPEMTQPVVSFLAEDAMFKLAVLTVSTSGSQGKRDDSSGQAIKDLLEGDGFQVVRYEIVSDDKDTISAKLAEWADSNDVDLIVTTGGTGLGRYDVTPEACSAILDKEVPGMAEAMRAKTLEFTPMAMISRSVTGIRGNTLIITLPGSTKGVQECLAVVMPVIPHALELLHRETVSEHPR
jgi:molybdenum cofactor synthesis domain-containing protein